MKIAVLGGGHGCYATAVEMSERGHETWFWRRDVTAFGPILENGIVHVKDYRGARDVKIAHPTASLAEAIGAADLVLIPLPAHAQAELAAQVAPLLRDGQVVFLPPGTLSTMIFVRAMQDAGNSADVSFAETGTLPYLVRKHGAAEIQLSAYATRLPTGVFPARNREHAFAMLQEAYPAIEPIEDVLSAALMNAGAIIHSPLIILNAVALEHFPAWDIHNEGTKPSVRSVSEKLDAERIAIREALGYGAPHFPLADHYSQGGDEWMYGDAAHTQLTESGDWREKIDLHSHRYMVEDTALGLSLLVSVGRWAGVPTPLASGLLAIASAITDRDFYAEGRTLERLGLADLTPAEMAAMLEQGQEAVPA